MTTRQDIETYVARWLPLLRLTHWAVTLDWGTPADDGDDASIHPTESYDLARMRLSSDFAKWTPTYAEGVVVHELLHLVTRDLEHAADLTHGLLPKAARELAEAHFTHEVEGVVDRIAAVLVAVAAR